MYSVPTDFGVLHSIGLFAFALFVLRRSGVSAPFRAGVGALAFALVFLSGFYVVADGFTGRGIDESVLYHLQYGLEGAGFAEYRAAIALAVLFLCFAGAAGFVSTRLLRAPDPGCRWAGCSAGAAALVAAFWVHPAPDDLVRLADRGDLEPGFLAAYRTPPGAVAPEAPPNLVVIYAESLERTYFDEGRFPGLIRHLRRWAGRGLSFHGVRQAWGTGWTVAGMTASQCGIPLVTPGVNGNDIADAAEYLPAAGCLGDVLAESGYRLSFMGGADLDFAGKRKLYQSHGFTEVSGKEELKGRLQDPGYQNAWGLYDDTLFDLALERYVALAQEGRPFGLFLLTLDTHHPDGHPSRRCEGRVYADGRNPILNAVACSDFLIGEFLDRVFATPAGRNTVVVVASDHLAMRNSAFDLLEAGPRENLFMAIAPERLAPREVVRQATTLDLGATLLDLIGAGSHPLGLGRSLLDPESPTLAEREPDIDATLAGWHAPLLGFWDMPSLEAGLQAEPESGAVLIAGRRLETPVLVTTAPGLQVARVVSGHSRPELWREVLRQPADQPFLWFDRCASVAALAPGLPQEGSCLFAGRLGSETPYMQHLGGPTRVPGDALRAALEGPLRPQKALQRRVQGYAALAPRVAMPSAFAAGELLMRSSGGFSGNSGLLDPQTLDGSVLLQRGIALLGFTDNGRAEVLSHVDPCAGEAHMQAVEPFAQVIARSAGLTGFALLVHDSAVCTPIDLAPLAAGLDLAQWRSVGFRSPYIALLAADGERLYEQLGSSEEVLTLRLVSAPVDEAVSVVLAPRP